MRKFSVDCDGVPALGSQVTSAFQGWEPEKISSVLSRSPYVTATITPTRCSDEWAHTCARMHKQKNLQL